MDKKSHKIKHNLGCGHISIFPVDAVCVHPEDQVCTYCTCCGLCRKLNENKCNDCVEKT